MQNLQLHVGIMHQTIRYDSILGQKVQQTYFKQQFLQPQCAVVLLIQGQLSFFPHDNLTNVKGPSYPHIPAPPPGYIVLVSRACSCSNAGEPAPGKTRAYF